MDVANIKVLIGKIAKSAMKLVNQIQEAAIECLVHAVLHGDTTLANQLIEATGKGTRKATLYAWFELNGPFYLPTGKSLLALDKEKAAKMRTEGEAAIRELLAEVMWTEAKPEPKPVSVYDVSVEFDKFLTRLNKLAKEPLIQLKHKDLLDALGEFSVKHNNEVAIKAIKALDPEQLALVYGLKAI